MATDTDRFGNRFAPNLSYARGKILAATSDDFTKLQRAWAIIRERALSILDDALAVAVGRPPGAGMKRAVPAPAR